jgi:exodeoxyribonuclease VII large subunit
MTYALFSPILHPMNDDVLSVSELTGVIRHLLTEGIGDVSVSGEISNYKQHSSGHRYFSLKDDDAQIAGVMWKSRTLRFIPEDGMRVVVHGRLSVYPPQGRYQIDVTAMTPAGLGDLHLAFEALKRKLDAKGYFALARKRDLPTLPHVIGVITSKTGAAIQDILSTIRLRFPIATVIVRPAMVQGDGAAEDVAQAIKEMQGSKAEVLIVGRGGGSIEDLWAFNTEVVADAIYHSAIPVISAVGHETDFTIADFVADVRAATPTAAAMLATPTPVAELLRVVDEYAMRMRETMIDTITELSDMTEEFLQGSRARRLTERIHLSMQRADDLELRSLTSIRHAIDLMRHRVDHAVVLCTTLHPLAPLRRGFAMIERNGTVLNAASPLSINDTITLRRAHDVSTATITSTTQQDIKEIIDGKED